jgi:iron(III) transport system substrate-binding protein
MIQEVRKGAIRVCIAAMAAMSVAGAATCWRIATAGHRDGRVVIYGTVETPKAQPIIAAFEKAHPEIVADYRRRDSAGAYREFRADQDAGRSIADIVWNSSMSAQVKLINDGYSQPYHAAARDALPGWAYWKDEGYAVTSEAMMFAINRDAPMAAAMPRSHRALLRMLQEHPGALRGRIGIVDPAHNEVAFMGYSQDLIASADSEALYRAIARAKPRIYESNRALLDALAAGQVDLAYNILGSYPLDSGSPAVEAVLPRDYLLTVSRIAFVARDAPHPAAARVFLDFLLSQDGQRLLASEHLGAVRPDVGDRTFAGPQLRPVKVGPALLADFDQMRRKRLLGDLAADMAHSG